MYDEGDRTPYGMHLTQCNIRRCWEECLKLSEYDQRKIETDNFNRNNRYKKRGIYIVPTKLCIGFGMKALNQVCFSLKIGRVKKERRKFSAVNFSSVNSTKNIRYLNCTNIVQRRKCRAVNSAEKSWHQKIERKINLSQNN